MPSTAFCNCLVPPVHADVGRFQVAFANIPEEQEKASCGSESRGKLPVQDVFGDTAMLHAMNLTLPAEVSLCKEGVHALYVGLLRNVLVRHMVLARNSKDPSQA